MVERLGNSCGAAGTPLREEQINRRSALMGSVTLPSLKTALMEGDRPGRTRRELHSEKLPELSCTGNAFCSGENDEEIGAGPLAASEMDVKRDIPAATAGSWMAGQPHAAGHSVKIPQLMRSASPSPLPDCCLWVLAARAVGIPKILSICEPRLAQLESNICNEGEKLCLIIGFPFQPLVLL